MQASTYQTVWWLVKSQLVNTSCSQEIIEALAGPLVGLWVLLYIIGQLRHNRIPDSLDAWKERIAR